MTTEPIDDDFDGPVFGAGTVETRPFQLVVHSPGDAPEGHREQFMSRKDVDAGMVIGLVNAPTGDAQLVAAVQLILSAAVDDDGLPATYVPPVIEGDDPRLDPGSKAYDEGLSEGDVDLDHDDYDPRIEEMTAWSSQRRLTQIFNDRSTFVKQSVLEEISQWMVQEGGGRPTGRPSRSSGGRQRTTRGSGGRRS